jgi:hypothetical protein
MEHANGEEGIEKYREAIAAFSAAVVVFSMSPLGAQGFVHFS